MKLFLLSALGALLSLPAPGQNPTLLSIYTAQAKPDKTAEFEAGAKRIVDASRKHKGSHWIALEVEFGAGYGYYFASPHANYAGMVEDNKTFIGAIAAAAGGPAGIPAFFAAMDRATASSHSEVRRLRPDLSANMPPDAERMAVVGKMRYVSTTVMHVRPGHIREFEDQIKLLAGASKSTVYVSQGALGTDGGTYYISRYHNSLAELDEKTPSASEMLGEEGYQKYIAVLRNAVARTENIVYHVRPDLSYPPPEIAAADPAYWNPKPAPAPKAKPAADAKK